MFRRRNPKMRAACLQCRWTGSSWLAVKWHTTREKHIVEHLPREGWRARRRARQEEKPAIQRPVPRRRANPVTIWERVRVPLVMVAVVFGLVYQETIVDLMGLLVPVSGGSFLVAYAIVMWLPAFFRRVARA